MHTSKVSAVTSERCNCLRTWPGILFLRRIQFLTESCQMSGRAADKRSHDLWYLSDARSVWAGPLRSEGQTGVTSQDNHFSSAKCCQVSAPLFATQKKAETKTMAKSTLTAATSKTAAEQSLLLVWSQDTVSIRLTLQKCKTKSDNTTSYEGGKDT